MLFSQLKNLFKKIFNLLLTNKIIFVILNKEIRSRYNIMSFVAFQNTIYSHIMLKSFGLGLNLIF